MKETTGERDFEQPVLLKIESSQDVDGKVQQVHMESLGRYFEGNGIRGVEFDECDDAGIVNTTTLTVSDSTVMMMRSGTRGIHMTFDRNRACTSLYQTPEGGALAMLVYPRAIETQLDRSGGHLALAYDLDYAGGYACRHRVDVTFRPQQL